MGLEQRLVWVVGIIAAAAGPSSSFHSSQVSIFQAPYLVLASSGLDATSSLLQEPLAGTECRTTGSISNSADDIVRDLLTYGSEEGREIIQKAVSDLSPNTTQHALGVATILADLKLDVASVVAGMLQCNIGNPCNHRQELQREFGVEISSLVKGVEEIDSTLEAYHQNERRHEAARETENYRKLILAMARDIRVVLIKLADQTQRMRMLEGQDSKHQMKVAQETLDLYSPLAHRLGMYALKTELEDISLRYWKPEAFNQLRVMVSAREVQRQQYTNKVIHMLQERSVDGGLGAKTMITGRAKSFFSIYQKMQQQNKAFDDIQDLMAFRILVDDLSQCYLALGIVHSNWKPVDGRFKDYIALPKTNGYQSLHTTVIGPEGKRMEVQIRTHDMHRIAEGGVAAHWMYKGNAKGSASKGSKSDQEAERCKLLQQLVGWAQQSNEDGPLKNVHSELFEKEVFVFSPRGQLFSLSKGATVLDFAYRVHSEVGNHCVGAKVNGKMVPLKYEVENGDTVEILQSSIQTPNQEWLKIVHTAKAKARIKTWLKREQVREDSITLGREMLEMGLKRYASRDSAINGEDEYRKKLPQLLSVFKFSNEQQMLTALAYGQISVPSVLQGVFGGPSSNGRTDPSGKEEEALLSRSVPSSSRGPQTINSVVVGGKRNILTSYCRNCNPLFGEAVQGVVTQGRGVKIHRSDCHHLSGSDPARRMDVVWDDTAKAAKRSLVVEVLFEDGPGMLATMSKAISSADVFIVGALTRSHSNGAGVARFELKLSTVGELHRVTMELQQESGVLRVRRISN